MGTSKNIVMVLGVTLISACSILEQPPAPNDTVTRLSNEMKAVPRVVPPKPDPRDLQIASLEQQLADRDQELARLRAELSTETHKLAKAERGLVRALRPEIEKGNISVDVNNQRLLIHLASNMLFGSGDDKLDPAGIDVLQRVGSVLKDYPEYKIEVSGHTDNLQIRGKLQEKFPTNMELSQARANSALQPLTAGGAPPDSSIAVGYADAKPIAPNATREGRHKNRRVEIRVTPKS
jgi:chemotaxis protein MotB